LDKIAGIKKNGIVRDWAYALTERMTSLTYEHIADGTLEPHDFADYEFVNRPEFIPFAREVLDELRSKNSRRSSTAKISENTFIALVEVFREWFNTEYNTSQ